jgi:hypothetical protein
MGSLNERVLNYGKYLNRYKGYPIMNESIKVVDNLGQVMFTVTLPERYVVFCANRKLLKRWIKSTKRVPIDTGNAGKDLEYDTIYDGYQIKWSDLKAVADEDDML